ncbi:chloroplastic lipocalin isoform X1 [Prunus yedoensis var. nudiflora]|uniref:Chloroplastic lipocalin isoform X1 n=1 Tax=Prunus yedoensis var. nudiflora TaxID=2094558 RepID=A0A314Y349_PRUYE|nr:chloroplastic lipocalin isoform X1 [Prunus yedoensis var. nudiflora]
MVHALVQTAPLFLQCSHPPPPHVSNCRGVPGKIMMKCCSEQSISSKPLTRHVLSGFAATLVFVSQINQAVASDASHQRNIYELANAPEKTVTLPLDKDLMKEVRS